MTGEQGSHAEYERNMAWRRSWPRCFLGLMASFLIIDTVVRKKIVLSYIIFLLINAFLFYLGNFAN